MVYMSNMGTSTTSTLSKEEELEAITRLLQIQADIFAGKHPQFSFPSAAAPIPPPILTPSEPWKLGAPPIPKPQLKKDGEDDLAKRLQAERQRLESTLEKQLAEHREESTLESITNGLLLPLQNGKASADGTSPITGKASLSGQKTTENTTIPPSGPKIVPDKTYEAPAPPPKKKTPAPQLPQRKLINYGSDSPFDFSSKPSLPRQDQASKDNLAERRLPTSQPAQKASPRLSPKQQAPLTWDRAQATREDQSTERKGSAFGRYDSTENYLSQNSSIPPPPPPQYSREDPGSVAQNAFPPNRGNRSSPPPPPFARRSSPPPRRDSPPPAISLRPSSPPENPRVSINQLQSPPVAPQPVRPALVLQHGNNDQDVEMQDGPFRERDGDIADVSAPRSARSPIMKQESMGNSPSVLNRIPLRQGSCSPGRGRPVSPRERAPSRYRYDAYHQYGYPPPPPPPLRRPEALYDTPPYYDPYARRDSYREYAYYPPPPPPPPPYGYPYRDYDPYARGYLPAPPPLPPREVWRGRPSISPRPEYPPPPASIRIRSSRSRSPDGRAASVLRSASVAPIRRAEYERSLGRASVAPPPVLDDYYSRAAVPIPPPLPYYPHDPYRRAPYYPGYPPPPPRAMSRASAYPELRGYEDRHAAVPGHREREMYPPPLPHGGGIPPPDRAAPPPFRERDYEYPPAPPPRGFSPAPSVHRTLESRAELRAYSRPPPPAFERERDLQRAEREAERLREYPPRESSHPHPPAPPPQEFLRDREREREREREKEPGYARYAEEERMLRREEDYERMRLEARSVRAPSQAVQGPPRDERDYMRFGRGYP